MFKLILITLANIAIFGKVQCGISGWTGISGQGVASLPLEESNYGGKSNSGSSYTPVFNKYTDSSLASSSYSSGLGSASGFGGSSEGYGIGSGSVGGYGGGSFEGHGLGGSSGSNYGLEGASSGGYGFGKGQSFGGHAALLQGNGGSSGQGGVESDYHKGVSIVNSGGQQSGRTIDLTHHGDNSHQGKIFGGSFISSAKQAKLESHGSGGAGDFALHSLGGSSSGLSQHGGSQTGYEHLALQASLQAGHGGFNLGAHQSYGDVGAALSIFKGDQGSSGYDESSYGGQSFKQYH